MYDKHTGRLVQDGLTQQVQMFPTPTDPSKGGGSSRSGDRINEIPTLQGMARKGMWPTPTAGGMAGGANSNRTTMNRKDLTEKEKRSMTSGHGGQLNPTWVEWLMGYPEHWTLVE